MPPLTATVDRRSPPLTAAVDRSSGGVERRLTGVDRPRGMPRSGLSNQMLTRVSPRYCSQYKVLDVR
ncbi:hypothetical protein Tco_0103963, partial [Tanacetum coccineum]